MKKIAIIGSGLSAVSAAKTLINKGIKPSIIDVGDVLDSEKETLINKMKVANSSEWASDDINSISHNPSLLKKIKGY